MVGFLMAGLALGVLLENGVAGGLMLSLAIKSKLIVSALLLFSLGLFGVVYSANVAVDLTLLIIMGASSRLINLLIISVIQRCTPTTVRGRVLAR